MSPKTRQSVIIRDFYTCKRCGKTPSLSGLQIAHRIKSGTGTENYIKKFIEKNYGFLNPSTFSKKYIRDFIIDNPMNLVTTCCLKCNDSFNIFNNEVERDKLLHKIITSLLS